MHEAALDQRKHEAPSGEDVVAAYGQMVRRTAEYLMSTMPWANLDDLIQHGVLALLEARERFDASRGVEFCSFAGKRIRGAMIDSLRREGMIFKTVERRSHDVENGVVGKSACYLDPAEQLMIKDDAAKVRQAIEALPKLQCMVMHLSFVEELNNREIAMVLQVTEAYVSMLRRSAIEKIAKRLRRVNKIVETGNAS